MDLRMCSHGVPYESGTCEHCQELTALRAKLAEVEQERDEWRDAVLNAAVISWVPSEDKPPLEIINDLLAWATQVALDPAVSEPVAKLVQDRDRLAAEVERLKHPVTKFGLRRLELDRLRAEVEKLKKVYNQLFDACAQEINRAEQAETALTAAQEENKRLEEDHEELRAENEELIRLVAKVRDESFPPTDAALIDRCIGAGATGCPKSALLWIADEIELLRNQLTTAQQSAQEQFRDVAVEFFYWWHNQPGSNTAQGFDEWWKLRDELSKGEGNDRRKHQS